MLNKDSGLYVQYGCGLCAPAEWINFDASPTLRIQKTPVIGALLKKRLNVVFPDAVKYGDVIKGLPVPDQSCSGVYCSHTLEHLSLQDFRKALANTYKVMKPGGIFRCIVPDLEYAAKEYLEGLKRHDNAAAHKFIGTDTLLGIENRQKGLKGLLVSYLGNSHHLWMWDHLSLAKELEQAGFSAIRNCNYNDCEDDMFKHVEDKSRFENAVAIECRR